MRLRRVPLICAALLGASCLHLRPASTEAIDPTPERLARGAYLANGLSGCLDCHATPDENAFGLPPKPGTRGAGGLCWDESMGFPGRLCAPNLTSDVETGLGGWTDGQILRAIREGIRRDDTGLFPIMPYRAYAELSDADATAIVAYLRTLPPVKSQVPVKQVNFPVSLFIKLAPRPLQGPVPEPNREDPVAYGRYLSRGCEHCHSPVNGRGQKVAGREFSGGQEFKFSWGGSVVSANLTPDPTGLGAWSKDQFVARFRGYAAAAQQPVPVAKEHNTVMPWLSLSSQTDEDLGALYTFLRTLPAIDNRVVTFPMPPAQ